jgi:hypothetical protein
LVPLPTATTTPCKGFSFAESGIINPEAVFVSAGEGSISTLSARGFKVVFVMIYKFKSIFISNVSYRTKIMPQLNYDKMSIFKQKKPTV